MLVRSNTCAWICEHPVDMRKSIDALAVLVEPLFNANPLSGHLFVFLCRHRIRVKILYWDRTGFALWYKRLEGARFAHPGEIAKAGLNMAQLSAWLEGMPIAQSSFKTVNATRVS